MAGDSMASHITSVKRLTARRKDPACGTCRKKCRKCDRKRPICERCVTKGLHCEGYPPRFQFCETETLPERYYTGAAAGQAALTVSTRLIALPAVSEESLSRFSLTPPLYTPSPYSPYTSPLTRSPGCDQDVVSNRPLVEYFEQVLSEHLTIHVHGTVNPFRDYIIPLIYQHQGILQALLGLSACHIHISGRNKSQQFVTTSLQYRMSALHSLGDLLRQEEVSGLTASEEEYILGMALLLVLHDICETGISSYGTHLNGVTFLCNRLASPTYVSARSKASMFLMSALSWLDILRGFSGAEKLAYSEEVRECIRDHGSLSLHTLVGCPAVIFHRIGEVLEAGKSYLAGKISAENFQMLLARAEKFFREWDPDQAIYPTGHQEWRHLAEAYRHACLLRIFRFPDALSISCNDPRIVASVTAILDVCAIIPRDTVFYKRLLFPLFLAGADTSSPHQIHYAGWCIGEIKHATGFQHPALTELLTKVWEERQTNPNSGSNVPWMEFTCSKLLSPQHAYLFF